MKEAELVTSSGNPIQLKHHLQTMLLVDDTLMNLELLEDIFEGQYNLPVAQNGEMSWALLQTYPDLFDIVLLDRMMPDILGKEVLIRMRKHPILKHVPVVFQTAKTSSEDINEGFSLGVDFYVTKPYDEDKLIAIAKSAANKYARYKEMRQEMHKTASALTTFSLVTGGVLEFEFRTMDQAQKLSMLLANACPEPDFVVTGLSELAFNAVEHGIAKIGYEEKTKLRTKDTWQQELEHRLSLPENKDKVVVLRLELIKGEKGIGEIHFTLRDPGDGFDHEHYKTVDQSRVFDNHGRGIAMSAMFAFDELIYNDIGNEVTAIVKIHS